MLRALPTANGHMRGAGEELAAELAADACAAAGARESRRRCYEAAAHIPCAMRTAAQSRELYMVCRRFIPPVPLY